MLGSACGNGGERIATPHAPPAGAQPAPEPNSPGETTPSPSIAWENIPLMELPSPTEDEQGPPDVPVYRDPLASQWDRLLHEAAPAVETIYLPDIYHAVGNGRIPEEAWRSTDGLVVTASTTITVATVTTTREALTSVPVEIYPGDVVIVERRSLAPVTTVPVLLELGIEVGSDSVRREVMTVRHAAALPNTRTPDHEWLRVAGSVPTEEAALLDGHFGEWTEERYTYDTMSGRGMYQIAREDGDDSTVIVATGPIEAPSELVVRLGVETNSPPYAYEIEWLTLSVRRGDRAVERRPVARKVPAERSAAPVVPVTGGRRGPVVTLDAGDTARVVTLPGGESVRVPATFWREGETLRFTAMELSGIAVEVLSEDGATVARAFDLPLWIDLASGESIPVLEPGLVLNPPALPAPCPADRLEHHPAFAGVARSVRFLGWSPEQTVLGTTENAAPEALLFGDAFSRRFAALRELERYIPGEIAALPVSIDDEQPDPDVVRALVGFCVTTTAGGFETRVEFENLLVRLLRRALPDLDTGIPAELRRARAYRDALLRLALKQLPSERAYAEALLELHRLEAARYISAVAAGELEFRASREIALTVEDSPVLRMRPTETPGTFAGRIPVAAFWAAGCPAGVVDRGGGATRPFAIEDARGPIDLDRL